MIGVFRSLLIGRPLPSSARGHEKLSISRAIGAFGLDALSSVAYGPDEILYVLVLAGSAGLAYALPIAGAIVALLAIVATSYRQTVHAYPRGGGSYTVARQNLGRTAGLVAASALMVDYVTTLAVSVTAGVEAVVAFVPQLDAHRVQADLACIALLVLVNLRGVREAGAFFVVPTYAFILSLAALVAWGMLRWAIGGPPPHLHPVPHAAEAVSLFLVLRAFSGGCTAMTGIEAIANGVPVFQKPASANAARTLTILAATLATLFLGIAFLGHAINARPSDQASVIAQVGQAFAGNSPLFYLVQLSSAVVLVLAANTSFNGFPLLAAIMAEDDNLPHVFAHRGSRLAYSNGIVAIGGAGALLVLLFGGSTHALIPLFAIGVFLSFTLSQAGMVRHWQKQQGAGWQLKLLVNGAGAATTAVVTLIVVATKLTQGAWVVVLIIPALVLLFRAVHRSYAAYRRQVSTHEPPSGERRQHDVLIPVGNVNRAVRAALEYALSSGDRVTAVHVAVDHDAARALARTWKEFAPGVPMTYLESPYREVLGPLLEHIRGMVERSPEHQLMVVVPEIIPRSWIAEPLHNQTAVLLAAALRHIDGVAYSLVPYRLGAPRMAARRSERPHPPPGFTRPLS